MSLPALIRLCRIAGRNYGEGTWDSLQFIISSSSSSSKIIITYLLQLGFHPVAVVLH
jgi:hypothetical protein